MVCYQMGDSCIHRFLITAHHKGFQNNNIISFFLKKFFILRNIYQHKKRKQGSFFMKSCSLYCQESQFLCFPPVHFRIKKWKSRSLLKYDWFHVYQLTSYMRKMLYNCYMLFKKNRIKMALTGIYVNDQWYHGNHPVVIV